MTGGTNPTNAEVTVVRSPLQEQLIINDKPPLRAILIGTTDWVDQGTGTYVKNGEPISLLQTQFDIFDPGTFLASLNKNTQFQRVPPMGVETKNGVQAVHYHADQSTALNPPNPTVPPGAAFDIWISTDHDYLVALEYSGLKNTTSGKVE